MALHQKVPSHLHAVFLLLLSVSYVKGTSLCVFPNLTKPGLVDQPCDENVTGTDTAPGLVDQYCDENVTGIDTALRRLRLNTTCTLNIAPGCYTIAEFNIVESVSDISILGMGPTESIVITCNPNMGLAFVNVVNLTILNLTLTNCGVRDDYLNQTAQRIQNYVDIGPTYKLISTTGRAIIIAECLHLTLENVDVNDTVGVGLTALNILGNSSLKNVHFYNNSRDFSLHDDQMFDDVAGGAMFYYGNSVNQSDSESRLPSSTFLLIENCMFMRGSSAAQVTRHILVDDFFEISDYRNLHNGTYQLDGAGGLSLIFARSQQDSQQVWIEDTEFVRNNHPGGGGMLILFQQETSNVSVTLDMVVFDDCHGGEIGGGLLVGYNYPTSGQPPASDVLHKVVVANTKFANCRGLWGGGSAVLSIPSFVVKATEERGKVITFRNCTWSNNLGTDGSALGFWEAKYHGVQKKLGIDIELTDCSFMENRIELEDIPQLNAAVVNLDAVSVVFTGNTSFVGNGMSCIGATRSEVQVYGDFVAEGSQAAFGGVLDFRDTSFLIVKKGANITFRSNNALWRGGAVSVNTFAPWPLTEFGMCFLHFEEFSACPQRPCYNLSDEAGTVHFKNNTAALFGNEIFGTTFQGCPWLPNTEDVLLCLQQELGNFTQFDVNLTSASDMVNGYMNNIFFNPDTPIPEGVMPGELWLAEVSIVDYFNQTIPAVSTLRLPTSNGILDTSGRFAVDGNLVAFIEEVELLRFEFYGTPGDTIKFQFLPIALFQPIGNFGFTFTECKAGFVYNHTLQVCECDKTLLDLHQSIQCQPNGTISHGFQRWIGFIDNSATNTVDYLYVTSLCVFDYCDESHSLIVNLSDSSEQCSGNRDGVLCGGCREGYSRVLGSTACKMCNDSTLAYLLAYVGSGILIVGLIFVLQISISSGYLNGLILYANCVSTFKSMLLPQSVPHHKNVAFVLLSLLNLDIGFETCFYDGMTQLQHTTLKVTYPIYLLTIIICIALFVKVFRNRLFHSLHPVGAIATVLFISFNNLLQSVVDILGIVSLTYHGHFRIHTEIKWLLDPTESYGRGFHGPLLALAILLLVFILAPVIILLLFFQPLLKVKVIGKLLQKLWPFFDAFQNPYVKHLRFWIGMQLLLRVTSLFIASFDQLTSSTSASFRSFSLFVMILMLATFTVIEAFLRPFKGVFRNVLDLVFLLDLLYLLTAALYYNIIKLSVLIDENDIADVHLYSTQALLYFAILLTILIFTCFVCVRFGIIGLFERKLLPKLPLKVRNAVVVILVDAGHTMSSQIVSGQVPGIPNRGRHLHLTTTSVRFNQDQDGTFGTNYARYRDSIFETESTGL